MQEKLPAEFLFVLACKKNSSGNSFCRVGGPFLESLWHVFFNTQTNCLHVVSSILVSLGGRSAAEAGVV